MPNYDLGTAHGQIVIDYDDKGTSQASKSFTSLGHDVDGLRDKFFGLGDGVVEVGRNFGSISQNFGRNFGVFSGGIGIVTALILSLRGLSGGLLGLRSGISTLNALRTVIGGVPKSIAGFPNVLKQIVLLSSAITLVGGGLKILQALSERFTILNRATPVLKNLRNGLTDITRPVKDIAKLVLTIGTFITATKFVLSLAVAIGKLSLGITALVGGITIIHSLWLALMQLSGVVGLLPAAFTAAAVSAGVLVLGLHGMSKAIKDMGDPKKFAEDLKGLAPAAAAFVKQIAALKSQFKGLQLSVQNALFRNLANDIRPLAMQYLPILHTWLVAIASTLNGYAQDLVEWFGWPSVARDVNTVLGNIHASLVSLEPAWIAILHVMDDVITVGSTFLPGIATAIGAAATAFARFVDNARATGQLAIWIQNGITAVKLLASILGNLIGIVYRVFGAFNLGGSGILVTLNNMTTSFNQFLSTVRGQQDLHNFVQILLDIASVTRGVLLQALAVLGPVLIQLAPFVRDLAVSFGNTLANALKIIAPILQIVVNVLNFLGPVITPILGALFALGAIVMGVGAAFSFLAGVFSVLMVGVKLVQGVFIAFRIVVLALQTAFWLANSGALGLLGTILLYAGIFLVIAAIVAGVVFLIIKYWTQIKSFLTKVWQEIVSVAKSVWGSVSSFFSNLWNKVAGFFENVWNHIYSFVASIAGKIINFLKTWGTVILAVIFPIYGIPALIIQHWSSIMSFFRMIGGKISSALAALPGIIGHAFLWAMTRGLYYVVQGLEWVIAALIAFPIDAVIYIFKFGEMMGAALVTAFQAAKQAVIIGIANIIIFFQQLPGRVMSAVISLATRIVVWWTNTFNTWKQRTAAELVALINFFVQLPGRIIGAVNSLRAKFLSWLSTSWNNWKQKTAAEISALVNFFIHLPGRVIDAIASLRARFNAWISSAWSAWLAQMKRGGQNIINWFKALPGNILRALGNLGNLLVKAGKAIITGLLNGLKAAAGALWNFVSGIGSKIADLKGPLPYDRALLVPAGQAIVGGLHNSIIRAIPAVLDTVRGIAPRIKDAMGSVASNVALGATATVGVTGLATMAAANAAGTGGARATAGKSAGVTHVTHQTTIENLNVSGNLDPSNPVAWRQTMNNLRKELRDLDRSGAMSP